jgi:predicted ferric reductase
VSDFIDTGYEHNLKALARKHDLVVIHMYDQRETNLPRLGIIPVYDTESRRTVWVNTSSPSFRNGIKQTFRQSQQQLERFCKQYNANYVALDSQADYVPQLIELFRVRKTR